MSKIKVFLIFLSIILVLSLQSISAHELNETQDGNEMIVADSPKINIEEMKNTEKIDFKIEDENSPGTFHDLQVEIDNAKDGSVIDLTRDYNADNSLIYLDKDLTIDGHGHTINCLDNSPGKVFLSKAGNIVLKNIKIINGHNSATKEGGAIYIKGTAQYTFENCTFDNNWATYSGGVIYNEAGYDLIIKNCRFTSNTANDYYGGAICSKGNVIVENSVFENNHAVLDGGAIYTNQNAFITNCTFENNRAEGSSVYQCYGGAICANGDVNIDNSTFKNNYAADYGGAIYANNVHINADQSIYDDINTFFINNRANDDDGGAIYAEGSVDALNTEFTRNSAHVDGGAIYSRNNVVACDCLFESNQANGAVSRCYGGAIRANSIAHVINSIFRGNYAEDRGGAIHATTTKLEGENIFERNVAGDYGGAIYTETFIGPVAYATFIDNEAKTGDGGAIYVNSKGDVGITGCKFINNRCKNDGGAVYLDSSDSHIWLTNNIFNGNNANKGQSVYAWGTYEQISSNFWAGNNPSPDNNQLIEYGFWSDTHHTDINPLRLDALIDWDIDENDKLIFNARIAYFTPNSDLYYNVYMVDAEFTIEANGKPIDAENVKIKDNQITLNFHPPMGTTVLTIHYGGYTIQKTITIQYTGHMGGDDSSYATLEVRVE